MFSHIPQYCVLGGPRDEVGDPVGEGPGPARVLVVAAAEDVPDLVAQAVGEDAGVDDGEGAPGVVLNFKVFVSPPQRNSK